MKINNSSGIISPLILIGMAVVVVFLLVSYSGSFSGHILSTIFPKNASFAATPGVAFVDGSNQPVTKLTNPMARVMLTSPWSVRGQASLLESGFQLISTANAQTPTSATLNLSASGNAVEDGNVVSNNQATIWIGNGASTAKSFTGIRYSGVNIPKGAKIMSARLQVYSTQSPWISVKTDIFGENKGNSGGFSNSSRPSQRALTSAKAVYAADNKWNQNTWYELADVSSVVQEIVNRADWNSGNSMSLILKGTGSAYGRKFVAGRGTNGAKLTVIYSVGTGVQPSPNASSTPSIAPSVAPSPSTAPFVVSAKIAEDSEFTKNVKDINPFTVNPTYIDYVFADTSYGTKTVYAKFVSSTGEEKTYSAQIQYSQAQASAMPSHDMSGGVGTNSHAMGLWSPNPKYDTCTKEQHDAYKVQGPDGKWYPTWHPPVDPSGCKFGHEHGRDPKDSDLFAFAQEVYGYDANGNGVIDGAERATAGIPLGYVNEQLDVYNLANNITSGMRHEDHVGHKFEWENNVERDWSTNIGGGTAGTRQPSGIICDMMMKIHQGTHSKDAFSNNMHEVFQFAECSDGLKMANGTMIRFGKPGEFNAGRANGTTIFIKTGTATPTNSTAGSGNRSIPDMVSVLEHVLVPQDKWSMFSNGLYEDWISGNYITNTSGTRIAYFDPHFAVFTPSRFYWDGNDPNTYGITRTAEDKANNVGRSIDVCYMTESNGEKFRGGECTWMGELQPKIAFDDPRSAFNGVKREMYFNNFSVEPIVGSNTIWFADPLGGKAQTSAFAGSVKQFLKPRNNANTPYPYPFESDALGGERYYGGNGVHAPN